MRVRHRAECTTSNCRSNLNTRCLDTLKRILSHDFIIRHRKRPGKPWSESMNILIVDDHPLILQALKHVLGELDLTINVAQTRDATSTFEALARPPLPHLLLLDLT